MNPTALTEMIGRVLGDRYRIEDLIGAGSVSAVFLAYDLDEARSVALKVFDESLCADEQFVARLLVEVERAATLEHTNIAEIYDWGIDDGPYIVSELCEGGSLAALLDAGHRLTASQALVVTLECSRALHHGHQHGVVHRNLKPSNVLFAADQRLRIGDFGLAQVLADAPSARLSSALDTVRYASPEQARGRPVTGASDLYSLALVANEAVSGEPPVVAETVVGTLMARAELPAELSSALEGLLPPLERCGRVDPDQRPEAEELTIALLATAETMARPAAFPVVGIGRQVGDPTNEPAMFDPSASGERDEPTSIASRSFESDDDTSTVDLLGPLDDLGEFETEFDEPHDGAHLEDEAGSVTVQPEPLLGLENLAEADPIFAAVPGVEGRAELDVPESHAAPHQTRVAYQEHDDDADERLPWWPLALLFLLVGGAVAAGVYVYSSVRSDDSARVPDLIGVPYEDLDARIGGGGWQVDRLEDRIDGSVLGTIVAQSPEPGTRLDEGDVLSVTVSLGNEMVEIPSDVVGLTVDQAASRLGSVGLTLGGLTEENSESLAAGLIVGLDEPTSQKPSGQSVALRVSAGPESRTVPQTVIGMSMADATGLLTGLRLQAVEEPVYDPDAPAGTVLASIPEPGSVVPADSQVSLLVSAGPEPVVMPDIIGLALGEAIDAIEELGLIYLDVEGAVGEDAIGSIPPIGATVDIGTEVTIILADPPVDEDEGEDN